MANFRLLALIVTFLLVTGCAYSVHQNHIGDFLPYAARGKGRVVLAEAEKFVIFADFSEMEIVEMAYKRLLAQCPNSNVVGVSTHYATDLGFFSWTNKVRLEGLCLN